MIKDADRGLRERRTRHCLRSQIVTTKTKVPLTPESQRITLGDMRETKQRSVRLDLEDLQKLMAMADRDRLDVSDLIRRAVREFLQREREAELEKAKVSRLLAGIQRKP